MSGQSVPQVIDTPTRDQLKTAAQHFSNWVISVYPGARTAVCGGAALSLYGNPRTTRDLDVAIDLTGIPGATTNALKDRARSSGLFHVGPKIYMKLTETTMIQVDLVDAAVMLAPWSQEKMVPFAECPGVFTLALQSLLVHKIMSAQERSFPHDINLQESKILSDLGDIMFLLPICVRHSYRLRTGECGVISQPSVTVNLHGLVTVMTAYWPGAVRSFVSYWNSLANISGLDATWKLSPV